MGLFCNGKNEICDYVNNSSCEEVCADVVLIPNTSKKKEFIGYATCCLICGEVVATVPYLEISQPRVCDKCKAAVMKAREQYERTGTD